MGGDCIPGVGQLSEVRTRAERFLHNMCAAGAGQTPAWWVTGLPSGQAAVWNLPRRCWSVHSHQAAVLLLSHPARLTGTIPHGYGWGCQGLPCILSTFGQDLITVSGTLHSSLCQSCFLSCQANNASLGFVAKGLVGCLECVCRS